jgi:hypothetical protein
MSNFELQCYNYNLKLSNVARCLEWISFTSLNGKFQNKFTSSSYQHNTTVTSDVLYCYFLLYFQIYCNISLSYTFKSTYIIIKSCGLLSPYIGREVSSYFRPQISKFRNFLSLIFSFISCLYNFHRTLGLYPTKVE